MIWMILTFICVANDFLNPFFLYPTIPYNTQQGWGLRWELGVSGGETMLVTNSKMSNKINYKHVKYLELKKAEPRIELNNDNK